MKKKLLRQRISSFMNIFVVASLLSSVLLASGSGPSIVSAQVPQQQDKLRIGYNDATGKVSFIGADPSRPIAIRSAQAQGLKADSRALAMISPYAADFGLKNTSAELKLISADQVEGREVTRFQQVYKGIPVMGGEMIVNANERAELLSLSGEISPDLALDTISSISSAQAQTIALELMAKSHQVSKDAFEASEPELWIYDSRLFEFDGTQATLVWRLEVKSTDNSLPVNELVLVDAKRGSIVLNFNQIDTAWVSAEAGAALKAAPQADEPTPAATATEIPTTEPTATPEPNVITPPPTANSNDSFQPTPTSQTQPAEEPAKEPGVPYALTGPYYVDIADGNNGNSCTSPAAPCRNIQETINKASAGDTIYVTSGTYSFSINASPNVVIINKNLTLSGGWDSTFTTQSGASTIDGANANNGILAISGTVIVENFIVQNSISSNSGGIYIVNGNFTLRKSTLKNNTATNNGAGIFLDNGILNVVNSTISGNTAASSGGGIYAANNSGASVTIQNSTIAYNTASMGGGIRRTNGTFSITNTIIANNTGTASGPDCNGTIAAASYSIIENMTGCTITTASNNLNVDPQIDGSLSGTMQVHALQSGSPAINAGTAAGCPVTDQRGVPRPQGASCDIGAYEYYNTAAASVEVSSGSPQNAMISTAFSNSLIAVVEDAIGNPVSGVTVTFTAPGSGASGTFSDTLNNVTTATTNASGFATASAFTANSTSGSYIVEAAVSGIALPAQFDLENFIQTATTISVNAGSPQAASLNMAFASPLKALVVDQFANPVQGVTVTFTAPGSGASGTFANTSDNVTTATTNASGLATASAFTANSTSGSYIVEATVSGIALPAQFDLENFIQTATTISVNAGSPQAASLNMAFASPLKALVVDQFANPMQGISVTFTAPESGASGTFAASGTSQTTVNTDASGIATTSIFTANNTAGNFTVSASVIGIATPASFSLTSTQGLYVSAMGVNGTSTCTNPSVPCLTINYAISQAAIGQIIHVQQGTYTAAGESYVFINKGITLSGGWNSSFSLQNGFSIIDGENARVGIVINSSGSDAIINNFVIQNGYGVQGGGIRNTSSSLTINNSTIKNSRSSQQGGGIYSSGNLILNNVTISNNTAGLISGFGFGGGGIYQGANSLTIQNSTIANNTVFGSGATSIRGGGIYDDTSGTIIVRNSIISDNTAYSGNPDCYGTINISDHNIISNSSGCTLSSSTSDQINVDPLIPSMIFGNFLPPILGSPAINSADTTTCTINDQRGFSRLDDGFCDMGAYEYTVPGPAASLIVSEGNNQAVEISHTFAAPLSIYVVDANGSPVSGETVTFTAPNSGASGIFGAGGTNTTTVTTNSWGLATASTFTANSIDGNYVVEATVSGIASPAQFQLENQVAVPATVTVSSGSSQSTYLNIDFTNPISALVKDQFGTPMQGVTVTFTAPASGASSVFNDTGTNTATAITNASGIATSFTLTANGTSGTYTINAAVSGIAAPAAFQMTNSVVVCAITNQTNYSEILFKPYKEFRCGPSGSASYGIGSGDFNNDGRQDIALSHRKGAGPQHMLLIFLRGVDGSYPANPISYAGGNRSEHLAVGDLNNDGRLDVATADYGDNTVSVYLQQANGTMAKRVIYSTGNGPDAIAIDDVNDDGLDDIVVSHGNSATIGVFTQAMAGTLNVMTTYASVASGSDDIAIGDVNHDGLNDVVKMNGQGSANPNLMVYLQSVNGTLDDSVSYSLGCNCLGQGIAVGDVTGDGRDDVVMSYGGSQPNSFIAVFPQAVDGSLQTAVSYNAYDVPEPVEIADANSDGNPDVITAHGGGSRIGILSQNNSGQLGAYTLLTTPNKTIYYRQDLIVKDLNNDTLPDILLAGANGPIIIYRQSLPVTGGNRQTYTANNDISLPGDFLCNETILFCTNESNIDADYAHIFAGQTWLFYNGHHNRDSINDLGMTIVSSVNYDTGYDNAFWNGIQMVYGDGYPAADDVVAHELTHGVTQYESNLFYYYQSGAINESFSDVWGELFDQQNGLDGAQPGMIWYIGEDLPGGALRSMSNPPAYSDPDKMTSANYYTGDLDGGGVHTNSGINNKAAYLMVDGGSFNSKTVTAIGADKTLAVYYEVQANLLTPGADYADLYHALYQGCINLLDGSLGITSNDCQQVRNATDAVEMNLQPVANFNPEAPFCSAGQSPNNVFFDNLESGSSNWTFDGTGRWQYGSPYGDYAYSGTNFLYADDLPATVTNTKVRMTNPVTVPANGYLHFAHAYDFENYTGDPNFYDGGVLEYSTNGGANWQDANALFNSNGYNGSIYSGYDNPLMGRAAFVGTSHGYVSTRLDLSSLAGQSAMFRWRMGLDSGGSRWGWWLDDVRIYNCAADAVPLVTSILRADLNPSGAASVDFAVTFSESVTGVGSGDFALTTSGITGAAVTGVSGTGATRTVTVNTGAGSGTIRLDLVDNDSILDENGNRLGGTGIGNGTYTSGQTYNIEKTICYTLTLGHGGQGSDPTASPSNSDGCATGTYVEGENITLSGAISSSGWEITSWTGTDNNASTESTNAITMPAMDHTADVNYSQIEYTLMINKIGNGMVYRDVNGPYHLNDVVVLTAEADAGWSFSGWSECAGSGPCSVTMDGDKTVTATFTQNEYTLNVTVVGNGTVSPDIAAPYHLNDVVQLTASPNVGWVFDGWSVDLSGTTNPQSINMDGNKTVTATFTQLPGTFNKIAPTNGATGKGTTQPLSWGTSAGAASYEYCIDTTNDNECDGTWISTGTLKSVTPSGILRGQTYYWQVRAVYGSGYTYANAGTWWSYSTLPGIFYKIAPTDAATGKGTSQPLSWGASAGATSYEYCIDTTDDNDCDGTWTATGSSTGVTPSGIVRGQTYYWQVRAVYAGGYTYANAGTWWSYSTLPGIFYKSLPGNGASGKSTTQALSWGMSTGAASYEYCIDMTNNGGCDSGVWLSTGTNTSVIPSGILRGKTYYWQVRSVYAGEYTYANNGNWWSYSTVPGVFNKSAPANGASGVLLSPTLSWSASTGATSYEYCIDTTSGTTCDATWTSVGNALSVSPGGLTGETTYYWQVRSKYAGGYTYPNNNIWWSFTTMTPIDLPAAFGKTLPADGTAEVSTAPLISWGASSGADTYEYCVDTSDDDDCDGNWVSNGTNTSQALTSLLKGTIYYWQVRAVNGGGATTADGGVWHVFTTLLPGDFNKSLPGNGTSGKSTTQALSWGASAGATSYEYCIDLTDNSSCDSGVWTSTGTNTSVIPSGILRGKTYYWQVRSVFGSEYTDANTGTWWSYSTVPGVFNKSAPANGSSGASLNPALSWSMSTGATDYEYCIDTTSGTTCEGTWTSAGNVLSVSPGGLTADTTYYWQVRSVYAGGYTYPNSNTWWSFITIP